ncbi:hypothetical protein ACFQPG_04025 [Sphingomonas sp. GCM10030256]|uniref:hypothetical protein n=1 Tax=Sphingomonas sp. GCM10030256 TaxID=3273427 RepID=UPI0036070D94
MDLARVILFYILLTALALFAARRGGREERIAANVCLLATIATSLLLSPLSTRFAAIELGVALIDVGVLAAFVAIALRSARFWPLWVAGIQLTTVMGHLLKAVQPKLIPMAYGTALVFWSYVILLIIAVAILRTPAVRQLQGEQPVR